MTFLLDFTDPWIGVPERWPFPREGADPVPSIDAWLALLMAELNAAARLSKELDARVRSVMTMVAERAEKTGARHYVAFDGPDAAAFIAQSEIYEDSRLSVQSLREFAGETDPEQLGTPFAEDFTSAAGVEGARCYRYLSYDPQLGSIYGRVDYVFHASDQILVLTSMHLDLELFQRLLPRMEELASSVFWSED